ELAWAHQTKGPKDIPRGAYFFLDVVNMGTPPQGAYLQPAGGVVPNSLTAPQTTTPVFGSQLPLTTYSFTVLVVAENVKAQSRKVEFVFDPTKPDLVVTYDNK